ncbi:alpha/beta fold hydrolase [Pseudonocardia lacus]|uniref:alpha/beta fold hydrolase n=1 Tax=Pseudonocardia lacus TaxID=2835865 RepID=UPI001BDD45E9|nr:alpha/beta hydrolase [Pseudonocardia lacus]
MATFVLVHGAWGGSYAFRAVRGLLHADGHEAVSPSLTGIGERAHLTGPHVDLSLHVLDVVNAIRYEDLRDVVLLGFSYGGMVVTGALDPLGDRVREVVYLDAFVPADGDSVTTLTGNPPPGFPELGAPWAAPAPVRQYEDPAAAARAIPRRVPQPLGTFTEPVRLSVPLEDRGLGLTYVRATADPDGATFEPFARRAREHPAWRYHEIATTHVVPENRPDELAAILRTLA